jgi:hypothetical protein
MTKHKILSAVLIATAMLTAPAVARASHASARHLSEDANPSASPGARYIDGHLYIPAPHVSAFRPAPPDGENCDVGDNPAIC